MKKDHMIRLMQTHIEGWSNLALDHPHYGDGYECCKKLLEKMELSGMLPPERNIGYNRYFTEMVVKASYKENSWEPEE